MKYALLIVLSSGFSSFALKTIRSCVSYSTESIGNKTNLKHFFMFLIS